MEFSICKKCGMYPAISPEGLCNICDPNALVKKSKELQLEAMQEDNDLAYMGKMKKAIREARLETFEDYIPKLEAVDCIVVPYNGQKVTIDTQRTKYGIIDFFPKANKVLIRKENKWKENGLKWLKDNLLGK